MKRPKKTILFTVFIILSLLLGANLNSYFRKSVFVILDNISQAYYFITNSFYEKDGLVRRKIELEIENQVLFAKILNYERLQDGKLVYGRFNYLPAEVYSRYPFNDNHFIMIDRGEDFNFSSGMPVVIGESILAGQIDKVLKSMSRVRTIFDPDFQFGVRIRSGNRDFEALFVGGNEPKATFIDKSEVIKKGDMVYTASTEFPIGLQVGEIYEISESSDHSFLEATIKTPYTINSLRSVLVITKTK